MSDWLWIIMQLPSKDQILTCELAWCHPPNPPPPLQGPVESNSWSALSLRKLLCQRRWLPQLLYGACGEPIKLRKKVFYLRGPSVLLVGCSQLTAPQELFRGDRRHLFNICNACHCQRLQYFIHGTDIQMIAMSEDLMKKFHRQHHNTFLCTLGFIWLRN